MGKFMVLAPSFLTETGSGFGPRKYDPGEIVCYDGEPGNGLYPLDDEARRARRATMRRRTRDQLSRDAMLVRRARRGFTGAALKQLDAAIAEFEMEGAHG